jgi:PAS domain S-box-containing protein
LALSVLNLHPEHDKDTAIKLWDKLVHNLLETNETVFQCKDGSTKEVEISMSMLPDGSGTIAIVRDITERNVSIKLIKESEERLATVLINSPIPLALAKSDNSIVFVNNQFTKTFGYELAEIPNVSYWWELAYPNAQYRAEVRNKWIQCIENHLNTGNPFEPVEAIVTCKDGKEKNIEFHYNDIGSEYLVSFYDVTERKLAELNLKKSEEKHRALIENIDDAILLIDENLTVFYQSPSVERIIGYTIEDRKGKKAIDFVHPDDREICQIQYEEAFSKPDTHTKREYRTIHKNGYYIWIEVFIMNLKDNESIQAYVVVYRDITARKKYEEQQLLMSSIVNSSYDAIISKNLDGVITSWNRGAEKILGYTASEMIGNTIHQIIPHELFDEEMNIRNSIGKGDSVSHFETKRIKKDGQVIDVSLVVSPIRDAKGQVIGASKVLRDITERKRAEQQLIAHNAVLSEIAFLQSHIVRRPVANVLGIINLLNLENPSYPTNIELIPILETASKELDSVISQIVEKTNKLEQ